MKHTVSEIDMRCLKVAVREAEKACDSGRFPFGAVLADCFGNIILKSQSSVAITGDITGHAPINVLRLASMRLAEDFLSDCTLYASGELCTMCCGAFYCSGVSRVVFALSVEELIEITGKDQRMKTLWCDSSHLLNTGPKSIEVLGPVDVPGAREVQLRFWNPEGQD